MSLPTIIADTPLAEAVQKLLHGKVSVLPWQTNGSAAGRTATGLYTYGHPAVDGALLDQLPNLKVISNYGVGVDHIDLKAAQQRKLPVGNTPGILNGATADMAFALLLAAARRLIVGDRYARSDAFTVYDPCCMLGTEVHGQTIGIVGMGGIGCEVAQRARGFNMRVLYHNRSRSLHETRHQATLVPLDQLLAESDFVVLTCPLTKETRGLINAAALRKMKPSAVLVNVARGGVVDTAAIAAALQQRTIFAAALDVTDPEPLPRNHPLLACDKLVIAPHLGSATEQTRQKMAEMSVTNLLLGLVGEPLLYQATS